MKVHTTRRSKTKQSADIGNKIPDLNEYHVNFQQPVLEDFGPQIICDQCFFVLYILRPKE